MKKWRFFVVEVEREWYKNGIRMVLQWYYNGITMVLLEIEVGVKK